MENIPMFESQGGEFHVDFWYPRSDGHTKSIVVRLIDTRVADDIRVSYDFDRDGWKIEQARFHEWAVDDRVCDPGWVEVAFIRAWASEIKLSDR